MAVVDFAFHPGSLTIHAGDTVTWTNSGAQPHTATANDRSFDTGILRSGQSASHTFARAGTFTYFCTVHPSMHGTVVVLPGAGGPPASHISTPAAGATPPVTGGPAAGPPASPGATAAPAPTLPLTGQPVLGALLLGAALIALGGTGYLLLRRSASQE